jgi:hypothetical protein
MTLIIYGLEDTDRLRNHLSLHLQHNVNLNWIYTAAAKSISFHNASVIINSCTSVHRIASSVGSLLLPLHFNERQDFLLLVFSWDHIFKCERHAVEGVSRI